MLQDMDNIEPSVVIYVKVGTFTHPEQGKKVFLPVKETAIVRLTVHHDGIASFSFMQYPGHSVSQTSADVVSFM
jgi:hypothetical protein